MNKFNIDRLTDDTIVISINKATYICLSDLEARDLYYKMFEVLRQ